MDDETLIAVLGRCAKALERAADAAETRVALERDRPRRQAELEAKNMAMMEDAKHMMTTGMRIAFPGVPPTPTRARVLDPSEVDEEDNPR